jgi:hypothetical protein
LKTPNVKTYRTDQIFHVALILPRYNCDLSPTELAWAAVKCFIGGNTVGVEFSLNQLCDLTDTGISSVTEDWKCYSHHVKTMEETYYKNNSIGSGVIDRIMISNPHEEGSSGDEDAEEVSSKKMNSDSSDSELAYPLD